MSDPTGAATLPARVRRRAALASVVGTTVEWYDYFIFGTASALVFNELFFPDLSPAAGTLAAFAGFGVGFLARPFGTILFGHFGDRVGRKPVLVASLLLMGVATVLIGLLPTHASIGIWAPVLLVVMRLVQGIGVGGEWGGAALVATEHAPTGRRGLYGTAPIVGVPLGTMLSAGVFSLVTAVCTEEQLLAWGWRIPFLLSGVLIVVGLVIRSSVEESPVFRQAQEQKQAPSRLPVWEVLRTHPRAVLLAAGALAPGTAIFYIAATWTVSYATSEIGFSKNEVLNVVAVVSALGIAIKLASGWWSDRIGRRPMIATGCVIMALIAFPYFWLMNTGSIWLFAVAAFAVQISLGFLAGPIAALFSELFETRLRYSGASLSYQLSTTIAGGTAPVICAALYAGTGAYWPIAVYIIGLSLLGLMCITLTRETYGNRLDGTPTGSASTDLAVDRHGQVTG
ncbi:MFS transporter [Pseudonocardia sp. KRD291]|uniref:MFS transporter n=1 Tax=Pseudonocardia sp. KRD291 TaxID=2792007 RepID=UPI001CF7C1BB|nr:MFS transporter [Pseudonocardia sp. KRD291]